MERMSATEFRKMIHSEGKPQNTMTSGKAEGTAIGPEGNASGTVVGKSRWDELKEEANAEAPKEKVRKEQHESNMQLQIMGLMKMEFRQYAMLLVHNCNEFRGSAKEGAKRKNMGVRRGFPDLTFFMGNDYYHGLHIELKYGKNKQSEEQKEYQRILEQAGYQYVVCKSVEEFEIGMTQYITMGRWGTI